MSSRDATLRGGSGHQGLGPASELPSTGLDLESDVHGEHHPGNAVYVRVAIILTIITAVEVAIYYIEGIRDFLVPLLIVLSVSKFVAVVGYFMHLKFDDRRFMLIFVGGLSISIGVVAALVIMFWTGQFVPDLPAGPGSAVPH
jgi:cytochrome c oxidase subunit 4